MKEKNLNPPWKPGQSGNPKGRKKGSKNIKTQIKEFLETQLDPVIAQKIQEAGIQLSEPTREQAVLAALFAEVTKGNVKAAEILLDRLHGKPLQQIEQTNIETTEERQAQIKEALGRMEQQYLEKEDKE